MFGVYQIIFTEIQYFVLNLYKLYQGFLVLALTKVRKHQFIKLIVVFTKN
jgi:hypothetical protein